MSLEIEIGANADFLSAGAEANITASKNDEGEFEIGAEAGIGALLLALVLIFHLSLVKLTNC